jgi:hypothetical protein
VIKTLSLHDAHFTTTDCTNATIIFKKTTKPEKALRQHNKTTTSDRRDRRDQENYCIISKGYFYWQHDSTAQAGQSQCATGSDAASLNPKKKPPAP